MLTNNKNRLIPDKSVIKYTHFIYAIILICATKCGPVLDNFPITFEMSGETSYIPDSGGVARNGYKLKIGYAFHQWLAA